MRGQAIPSRYLEGKSPGCLFLQDPKAKQVFYLLPGKVSRKAALSQERAWKQGSEIIKEPHMLSLPLHLWLCGWNQLSPEKQNVPRNVLPHPLPIGHVPSHLLCPGMLGHAGQAQLDAALGMPHRTLVVSESKCSLSFPQHAKGSPLVACEWSQ